jgi:hypothetical protein
MTDRDFPADATTSLFEPDVLLPVQHARRTGVRRGQRGEHRLMMAILEDAVDVYLKHAAARQGPKRDLFVEAEAWVNDDDTRWIFSFLSICHVFDLDPAAIREGLHAHKRRVRGERGTVVPMPVRQAAHATTVDALLENAARA